MRKTFEIFIEKKTVPKTRFERKTHAIVSLPEQFSPNKPSKHSQCPSFPQVPWPLHVVLGLQNAETNERKVSKFVFQN